MLLLLRLLRRLFGDDRSKANEALISSTDCIFLRLCATSITRMLYSMVHDAMETDSLPTDKRSSSHKHPRALHGNYTNYYAKRSDPPHVLDPRLSLIPARYWVGKAVLDLGCNSGRVTLQVGQLLGAKSVKGLDIDSVLIARAQKSGASVLASLSHSFDAELGWYADADDAAVYE